MRVAHEQYTRLDVVSANLICECARCVSTADDMGAGVLTELVGGTLTELTVRDNANVLRVLNGNEHTSGEDDLLPGLGEIEDVNT